MINIKKADGTYEPYDRDKLISSLKKAKAPAHIRNKILSEIETKVLYEGIPTSQIYSAAFDMLKRAKANPIAARYSLKRAVLGLGPSGFPFEKFVAGIFKAIGYRNVKTGLNLKGNCAEHEVDVYAVRQDDTKIAAELKFHNSLGVKTDIKVAMYVKARGDDLKNVIDETYLITNTRFTANAIRYGRCSGLFMIGWDYPKDNGIEDLIDKAGVHPITVLTTLKPSEKNKLLKNDIVLCRDLIGNKKLLKVFGVKGDLDKIVAEAEAVVTGSSSAYASFISNHKKNDALVFNFD